MKFSILVVTYNPVWEKLCLTLDSVLKQTFADYEIVISDDGSKDNCFPQLRQYFAEHKFERYVLVPHEKNQGTVKNLISALTHAQGKYVRDFGPGDAFYNEHTLQRVYDFLESHQYEGCFGLMRGYCRRKDGTIQYTEFPHPFDLAAYQKQDMGRIVKNLVMYRDNASGACTCYTREYYLEYLKRICGTVIYAEDIFQVMAGLDGRALQFFPEYLVWYEADMGVSTKKKSSFAELLALDVEHFYGLLQRDYPNDPYVKRQRKVLGLYKIRNLYLRTMVRFFVNPDAVVYLLRHIWQQKTGAYAPQHAESGFLDSEHGGV
jgi:glycosyltransferase involved in cell wall biosynthesis